MPKFTKATDDYYRSLVHSLPFSLAVIDGDGQIIGTNSNWDDFGEENGLDPRYFDKDVNYLDVCLGADNKHASRAVEGIKKVISGARTNFKLEYPCHSDDRKHWFVMQVYPLKQSPEEYFIVTHLDITGRKLSEQRSQRLSTIVDRIPVCIVTLKKVLTETETEEGTDERDDTFVITNFNPHAEKVTGLKHQDVLGRSYREVFDELFGSDLTSELLEVTRENVNFEQEEVESKGYRYRDRFWSLQAFNVTGEYLSIDFEDITGEVQNRRKLEYLAAYDELTDLLNRDHLLETLSDELERAKRYSSHLSFLLMDLDKFKDINDNFGHVYGDEILEGMGEILNEHTRSSDLAGRYGGEEFGVLLPETDIDAACQFAERLREDIEDFEVTTEAGESVSVTCSIGVSEHAETDETMKDILGRTDDLLYQAKEEGRNRVVCDENTGRSISSGSS
ncbi:MAG: diguanylate cyclase [bacterium]